MLETVKGLRIKGRCFGGDTILSFFPNINDRMSVVYGKNGSGKSTISDGLLCIKDSTFSSDVSASLVDVQGNSVLISDDAGIFVFNERYVDQNVKIEDEGLGTIVLLGEQVNIQEEIDKKVKEISILGNECECLQSDFDKYQDARNLLSPQYHWAKIITTLKQPGGWAEVDSRIKGWRRNSSVTDDVVKEICELTTTSSFEELKKLFDEGRVLLDKTADSSMTYPEEVKQIVYDDEWEDVVIKSLSIKIEEPILTDREKAILKTIQNGGQGNVEQALQDFSLETTVQCPYCYQQIEKNYKEGLIKSINKVLNKDVDEHKADLNKIRFPTIVCDIMEYDLLDATLIKRISEQIQKCQNIIKSYKELVDKKLRNIYTPIVASKKGLLESLNELNDLLKLLEDKRKTFNYAASTRDDLVKNLVFINKQLAHLQTKHIYQEFKKQDSKKSELEKGLSGKRKALLDIKNKLLELEQKKSNFRLAIDNINNALNYVFFEQGRLSIELKNNKYYLKSKGKDVMPKKMSLGERNIIALCYFFTQILVNQDVSKLYENEALVVVDDPISSFDLENKIGIMSFLRLQFNRIIKGNSKSKILILSHDLETTFSLQKAMKEICESTKGIANKAPTTYAKFELHNEHLISLMDRKSEYKNLLKKVYSYANGNGDDLIIGNTMRRVLEVFSTFNYQKGIEQVSRDKGIIQNLKEYSVYFENLMYRLVLHGESHYEEQVYYLHDGCNFYEFISKEEKQKTAKNILCFMYLLNTSHLNAYLKEEKDAIKNIQEWIAMIPKSLLLSGKNVEV